jgi:hypothetical protein
MATTTTFGNRSVGLGLFSKAVYDIDGDLLGCVRYINNDFDYMFKIGRALCIITLTFSTFTFVIVGITLFFKPKLSSVLWSLVRFLPVAATLSQIFTFMVLGSKQCEEEGCNLSGAGVAAVLNVFILSTLSVMANLVSPPTNPWFIWWNYDVFDASRETLVRCDERYGEFVPSDEAAKHNITSKTAIDMMLGMEDVNLQDEELPAPSVSEDSVHSVASVHESLASSTELQKRKGLQLITFIMIFLSWVISLVGVKRCTFLLVGPIGGGPADYSGIGLYTRASYNMDDMIGCLAYPDSVNDDFDTTFKAARAFGAITALLMTTVLLLCLVQLFTHVGSEKAWYATRALLPSALISQMLVFLAYRTDMCTSSPEFIECIPGGAGIIVIINIILMAGLTIFAWLTPPPSSPIFTVYRAHMNDEAHRGCSTTSSRAMVSEEARVTLTSSKTASLFTLEEEEHGSGEETESDSLEDYEPREKIVKIAPIARTFGDVNITPVARTIGEPEGTITISMEFTNDEKKTIKTTTYPDGSKTVTTTIEELFDESESEFDDQSDFDESPTSFRRKKAELGDETRHYLPLSKAGLESVPESEDERFSPPLSREDSFHVPPLSTPKLEAEDEQNSPGSVKDRIRKLEAAREKEGSLQKKHGALHDII